MGSRRQKKQRNQPKNQAEFKSSMEHMASMAFGKSMDLHIYQTCDRSDRMRDDQGLLDAAQAKRERKAAKAREMAEVARIKQVCNG